MQLTSTVGLYSSSNLLQFCMRLGVVSFMYRLLLIGDHSLFGWLDTLLYFVIAFLFYAMFTRQDNNAVLSPVWLLLCIGFLLLGINKQLDVHAYLINFFYDVIKHAGLLHFKYLIKGFFLVLASVIFMILVKLIKKVSHVKFTGGRLVWSGVVMLVVFVLMRFVTFSNVFPAHVQFIAQVSSEVTEFIVLLTVLAGCLKNYCAKEAQAKEAL